MALWASSMCFMHAASLPFFISAFDMSRCIVASFLGCFCRVIGGSCHYDKDVNNGDIRHVPIMRWIDQRTVATWRA